MASRLLCSHSYVFRKKIVHVFNFKIAKHASGMSCLEGNPEHDKCRKCFTVRLSDNGHMETAVLKYEYTGEREVNLLTTVVPLAFRGKGVAALLAKSAMDFVVEENLKARVSCWYIKKYIDENPTPEYKDQIVD
ncbi:hypothetical protein AGOR_G00224670 [Albula goreensis]|uniref:Protein NATD1 n=1 Tax=Albula goreensis TaxID=1534307 RepID=A0A8T3CIB4_9TELE|nr:hypothetical protein AGOR_G00224670 [Albula goreensis]